MGRSDANDFDAEHASITRRLSWITPKSGERIRGRRNIQKSRQVQPDEKRFAIRRIVGGGDLWVTEFILTYDGRPTYVVSIMELEDGLVVHETQYFADRFEPGPMRVHLVEQLV